MKIYYLEWKSFCTEDMITAFEELGHTVKRVPFSNEEVRHSDTIEEKMLTDFKDFGPDIVFSFNYFPIISLACKKAGLRYVSWVYDSPYVMLYSYTIAYPGNYVFVFDKAVYSEFHNAGINTVHYLPMAANTDRLQAMKDFDTFEKSPWKNECDIAFIGSLYTVNGIDKNGEYTTDEDYEYCGG